jgi:hypothetical protein
VRNLRRFSVEQVLIPPEPWPHQSFGMSGQRRCRPGLDKWCSLMVPVRRILSGFSEATERAIRISSKPDQRRMMGP